GAESQPGAGPGAARQAVPPVLLGDDRPARPARPHRHLGGAGDRAAGPPRPLRRLLLLAGGRDGPVLALCRSGVDIPAADAVPGRHAQPGGVPLLREPAMHGRTISPLTYTIVCVLLVLLTVLTVGVSTLPLEGVWHLVIGLAIAVCKASLVVLFF